MVKEPCRSILLLVIIMTLLSSTRGWIHQAPSKLTSVLRRTVTNNSPRILMREASSSSNPKVGFMGLGYMGNGMVRRLLTHNYPVVVWNRSIEKAKKLQQEFPDSVTVVDSPKDVVLQAEGPIFSMLSTPQAAREVFYAEKGTLAGLGPGKSLVDCATLEAKDMHEFYDAAKKKGARFLEAPVSGSKGPAETGTLVFLTGGDQDLFKDIEKHLAAMGKASFFMGPAGKGTEMKLVVNMIMGTMLASFAEGLTLTEKAGLSKSDLVSILDLGAMSNPMFKLKGPSMIKGDFTPAFPLKHATKDMKFAVALGKEVGAALPVAETATRRFDSVLAEDGELDFSAIIKAASKKP